MEIPLISDVVILLSLSVLVILIFNRLKLPSILGLLITGIIAGPHGLSLIQATHEVEMLAEIGVILLLFVIGLEFSLKELLSIKKVILVAGSVQVLGTIAISTLVFTALSYPLSLSVFMGFLFSLSSTAIVLKLLQDKGELDTPHGKVSLAVLIYQDIIVVLFMLLTPILAGKGGNVALSLALMAGKTVVVVSLLLLAARYIVPQLLYRVAKTKSKDLFVLTIVMLCFSVAWLTSSIGLSLALGAFMAGLVISESEYSHQATSNILPFRELFTSFFFVSIGMLLNIHFVLDHLLLIVGFTVAVSILKALAASLSALVLRYPPRTVVNVGLSLFQVGEFAFILSAVGINNNLLTNDLYQYFLAISIATMAITPFVSKYSEQITCYLLKIPLPQGSKELLTDQKQEPHFKDHLIIIGFGLNGRNLALAAKKVNIPYVILEMNPDTVKTERAKGEAIFYGDASNTEALMHLNVEEARVVVMAISDPMATKAAVTHIRSITPVPHIIIRTRFVHEINENLRLGANDVIPEEFETSIEIFTRVLNKYLIPQSDIEELITQIRSKNYAMFRPMSNGIEDLPQHMNIPEMNIACMKVKEHENDIVHRDLISAALRQRFGVTIVAIMRNGEHLTDIDPQTYISPHDTLYVLGKQGDINRFKEALYS